MSKLVPTLSSRRMGRLIRSVRKLQEVLSDHSVDLLEESLSTGEMSRFLFEADENDAAKSVKEAIDAANEEIDQLEKSGKILNDSPAIKAVVDNLRNKLAKIAIAPDKKSRLISWVGQTIKQVSWIGNGVAQVSGDIHEATTAVKTALDTLKIEPDPANPNGTIEDLIKAKEEDTKISPEQFKVGIEKKISKGAAGSFFGKIIKGFLGGLDIPAPVDLDAASFAGDIMRCTPAQIDEYFASPSGQEDPTNEKSTDVDEKIKKMADTVGVEPDEAVQASEKSKTEEPPGKARMKRDDWTKMLDNPEDLKAQVNSMAGREILENRHTHNRAHANRWSQLAGIREDKK